MPKVVDNIQLGFSVCRIGFCKCWQWLSCHRSSRVIRDQYQVLCLGLTKAGKSTILATLVGEAIDKIEPTTGFNIKTLPIKETVLDIKELGGADNVRPFWNRYFSDQHGILFVVDASSSDGDLKVAIEALHSVLTESSLKGVPCVILGTHQDKENARSREQLEQAFRSAVHGHKWAVQVCALSEREAVQQGLNTLVDFMTSRN